MPDVPAWCARVGRRARRATGITMFTTRFARWCRTTPALPSLELGRPHSPATAAAWGRHVRDKDAQIGLIVKPERSAAIRYVGEKIYDSSGTPDAHGLP